MKIQVGIVSKRTSYWANHGGVQECYVFITETMATGTFHVLVESMSRPDGV